MTGRCSGATRYAAVQLADLDSEKP